MAIGDIRTGDQVYSVHEGKIAISTIIATQRVPVRDHAVARLRLKSGFVVEISGEHPMGDGRMLLDLRPGDRFGQTLVEELSLIPYAGTYTVDILPDSDTGTYFVHGLWLASTMFGVPGARGDLGR